VSYLDSQPLESEGLEMFIDQERWNSFVHIVLDVTVQAYQNLYEKGIVKLQWEENDFTFKLRKLIRPLAYDKGIYVQFQEVNYIPELETGEIPLNQAKKLDLRMHGQWEVYDEVCFIWECKLIAPGSDDKHGHLVYKYIIEGMLRFFHEEWKYANYVDDSGMLGYVLTGEVPTIVDDINQKMLISPRPRQSSKSISQAKQPSLSSYDFSVSDFLKPSSPIGAFPHVYQSCHDRTFCNRPIHLYHLFLIFDFNNQNGS